MSDRLRVVTAIARNPILRRVEAAYVAFTVAEWATWIAIVIYAYGRGGAAEAGIVAFVQLVPSVFVAPTVASLGDRFPRARVLVGSYLLQALTMAIVTIGLVGGLPAVAIYLLATLTATAVTVTRPIQAALLPDVVDSPDELTAANAASGTIEGVGVLVGPALAGMLVALGGPALVFAISAAGLVLGVVAVLPVARAARGVAARSRPVPARSSLTAEITAGVAAIRVDPRLRSLALLLFCTMFLFGTLDIFYAILAVTLLDLGEAGIGYLGAATGVGMLGGASVAVALVGRRNLGRPLLAGAVVFGVAVGLLGVMVMPVATAFLLAVAGLAAQFVYVGIQTLTQRVTPSEIMSRVFGVFEAVLMGAGALGALSVPLLVAVAGERGAFIVAGLTLPVVALVAARSLLSADRGTVDRAVELGLLRSIPMFAPLSPPVLEALAAALVPQRFSPGTTIIAEGDPGDRYFILASGTVAVHIGGRHVHDQGPGEGFGEIALLRDVPRTATVRASTDVEAFSLAREPFLAALTGQPASRAAAERVVRERLAPPS